MQPTSTASNPLFDRDFLLATMMGPNCVRFAEELTANIPLSPHMRVRDLGGGMGLSSIYLARTFGVRVFAADLWIKPSDNFARFRDFGLEDAVIPLRAEGHALPFAEGYFDAVICIDAYHFFGCDPEYLDAHIAPLVKPGGFIAAAIPGLRQEFTGDIPDELRPYWKEDINFHSAGWWAELWKQSTRAAIRDAFSLRSHKAAWEDWLQCDNPYAQRDADMMEKAGWRYFDSIGIIATVSPAACSEPYLLL